MIIVPRGHGVPTVRLPPPVIADAPSAHKKNRQAHALAVFTIAAAAPPDN